jgi:hypothetical protein
MPKFDYIKLIMKSDLNFLLINDQLNIVINTHQINI